MSETMRMWIEITFNLLYLITVWGLVIAMLRRKRSLLPEERSLGQLFIWAFAFLALGDTGHVGFRVLAYALGGLDTSVTVLGSRFGLVGLGALSTAATVTVFYVLMLMIWHKRYAKPYGWFGYLLLASAAVRLGVMFFPQNEWNSAVPPQPWSIYRNAPLVIQGLGVAYLILRDAIASQDRAFVWIGGLILASYSFYVPVILFVQVAPMIGMLMIPKTMAYVGIGVVAYLRLFGASLPRRRMPAQ